MQAFNGFANTIFPCKLPDWGLKPIGDEITFILLSRNVSTNADGLKNTRFCAKQACTITIRSKDLVIYITFNYIITILSHHFIYH